VETLLAGYPVVVVVQVAWGEMDAYGHVNNAVYFRYLENGRIAYTQRIGWPEWQARTQVGPILAAVEARFRKPVVFPDTLHVGTRVASVAADRFVVEHLLVSEKLGAVAAEGKGTVVAYDYATKTKTALPEELRRRIEELEADRKSV
jgi:acyl-CoA thioester hydrolase